MDFIILQCINIWWCVNSAFQCTLFLIMGLNITIITSCDSLIAILVTLFLHHGSLKKLRNHSRIILEFCGWTSYWITKNETMTEHAKQYFFFLSWIMWGVSDMHHIKNLVCWNQSLFVKKEASIAITTRARLRNRFLKNRNTEKRKAKLIYSERRR